MSTYLYKEKNGRNEEEKTLLSLKHNVVLLTKRFSKIIDILIITPGSIKAQPSTNYQIDNIFHLQANENLKTVYECQKGCLDCCGQKTTIALTNTRIISRVQKPCSLFCCCTKGSHLDKTIFFKDICVLSAQTGRQVSCCLTLFFTCIW